MTQLVAMELQQITDIISQIWVSAGICLEVHFQFQHLQVR